MTPTKARHTYVADHIPAEWDEHIIEQASTSTPVSLAPITPAPVTQGPVTPTPRTPVPITPTPRIPAPLLHYANACTINEGAEVQLATDAFASSGLEVPRLLGMEWKGVAMLYVRSKDQKLLDERRRAEERRAKAKERKKNQRQRMAAIAVRVLEEVCGGDGGLKRTRRSNTGRVFLCLNQSGKPEAVYDQCTAPEG
jgi:hypothetical protein